VSEDLGDFRRLVKNALTAEDLNHLCFFYFPEVHAQFTEGQTHLQRLVLLLKHAETRRQVDTLRAAVREVNPKAYAEYEARHSLPAGPAESKADKARLALTAVGVKVESQSLFQYIRSGNGEIVRQLLEAGVSPNVEVDRATPLDVALGLIGSEPTTSAPTNDLRVAVLRAVVGAGEPPRGLGLAAHRCLEEANFTRLRALRQVGVGLDVRDAQGQSLAVRAMRRDNLEFGSFLEPRPVGWTRRLLREGPPPPPRLGAWMLLWAADRGQVPVAESLLKGGTPPDARLDDAPPDEDILDEELRFWADGGTALHFAVRSLPIARLLLDKGASVGAANRRGETALHLALKEHSLELASELVKRGASLTVPDTEGNPPLLHAIGRRGLFPAMMETGVEIPPGFYAALVHRAVSTQEAASLELLLKRVGDPNIRDGENYTPLLRLACRWGDIPHDRAAALRCLDVLLGAEADVAASGLFGYTPLRALVSQADGETVERLLRARADPNAADEIGDTPLMHVHSADIADLLLRHGARPDARNRFGHGVLDWAEMYNNPVVLPATAVAGMAPTAAACLVRAIRDGDSARVQNLLTSGTPADSVDGFGDPVLHLAAGESMTDIVRLLLDAKADVNARDRRGRTPLFVALTSWVPSATEYNATINLLLDRGASIENVDGRETAAVFCGGGRWWRAPALVRRLLAACRDARSPEGETVLVHAIRYGTLQQMKELGRSRPVDERGEKGRTPLFEAAKSPDDLEKAEHLLDLGAAVNAADADGDTPLIVAAGHGNGAGAQLLLEREADPLHRNNQGQSALDVALRGRNAHLVNLLRRASETAGHAKG
jgi:ankyrin repeat protein